ncbi:formate/nitrite transporter family protein [Natrialba asiatica]|uniref:Formate/nitrite transporter n=1 Tax=Natrialba asiatica (strain ATCC 700177 / DSM 12278 / JCM 9576 / FERM P-10747 / NBRC 102637 / 172P1) TaxID=29540 RepID=M0ATZ9_NATA1|nr:formate/nitrite transporter family protein [Natrialba asiatica]ELZ00854.1 formate/nitrite transporter [Natrialba asiatica DSM 12278]
MSRSTVSTLTTSVTERDHSRGPDDAPLTLVQYADFECPSCGNLYDVLERLQNQLGDQFRVVFRHFPLTSVHPHALRAAEAAEAAAAQGKFWEMHDVLYENQGALAADDLVRYAAEIGLDTDRFVRELENGVHQERIEADVSSGAQSGVDGTPTVFINGRRYDGPAELDALHEAIVRAGDITAIQASIRHRGRALRDTIDRSQSGAPAAGAAIRDYFSADEIFQRIVATADEEFSRSNRLLFMSGLAAGFAVTLTFLARSAVTAAVPSDSGELIGNLFYPVGFVLIVMGRYQLFTENTLTPVTLVLTRIASVRNLLRLWVVVIVANVLGAALGALVLATTGVFTSEAATVARGFGEHAFATGWWDLFFKAVFAGNIVAAMVWLVHASQDTTARFLIIVFLMFLIPATDLFHCITGMCEVLYFVFRGQETLWAAIVEFFVPVTLGNIVGGVLLVALLNYSQTAERQYPDRDASQLKLSWAEWLYSRQTGHPQSPSFSGENDDELTE